MTQIITTAQIIVTNIPAWMMTAVLFAAWAIGNRLGIEHEGNLLLVSGYAGTLLIILSMTYSLRKRVFRGAGALSKWIFMHEVTSLTGTALVMIHAGGKLNTAVSFTALFFMLLVVLSGFTGRYILVSIRKKAGQNLFLFDQMTNLMRSWRMVHITVTALAFAAVIVHSLGYVYYGGAL